MFNLTEKFENLKHIAIGAVGAGTSAGVENISNLETVQLSEGASLVTQIVILIATLISLFKKKKNINNQN